MDVARQTLHLEAAAFARAHPHDAAGHVVVHHLDILDSGVDVVELHVRYLHPIRVHPPAVVGQVHLVVHVVEHQLVGRHREDFVLLFLARLLVVVNKELEVRFVVLRGEMIVGVVQTHAIELKAVAAIGEAVETRRQPVGNQQRVVRWRHPQDVVHYQVVERHGVQRSDVHLASPLAREILTCHNASHRLHNRVIHQSHNDIYR